ncbi:MAG TPA: glycosyltransferase [Candidatus Polarisedimenticolia bacterium]|jgi:glycosyltransferase involved in cell wall biosynthesis
MKRIAVLCEVMHAPFDEGIRIFAAELARALSRSRETLLVSGKDSELDGRPIHGALTDRWFLSRRLAGLLRGFDPDEILYIPWTSLTARTLVRAGIARRSARRAVLGVAALQPRPVDLLMRTLVRAGGPDVVMAAGPGAAEQAARLGLRAVRISTGVDLSRFRPAAAGERATLRSRAGIDPGRYVVLHVGHLKESRNVGVLERLARLERVTCMLVASSSTVAQKRLASRLGEAGVVVMTHHQDRIEFAYRLADAYLFPVTSTLDAIEMPLSVLEAAACDLAIVSTPFGALPELLPQGIHWARTNDEIVDVVGRLASGEGHESPRDTRRLVEAYSWHRTAGEVLDALDAVAAGR